MLKRSMEHFYICVLYLFRFFLQALTESHFYIYLCYCRIISMCAKCYVLYWYWPGNC